MSHNFCYVDFFSHGFPSVVGRDLLTLKDFTSNEIGYLLWSAADLKERIKTSKEVGKTFNIILMFTSAKKHCLGVFLLFQLQCSGLWEKRVGFLQLM